jgi:hypothetical protein
MRRLVCLFPIYILILFNSTSSHAQSNFDPHIGGQIGLSLSFGTHVNRIGLMTRIYYAHDWAQFNLQSAIHYNFKSLGSEQKGWEARIQPGFVGAWGRRDSIADIHPYINSVSTQTARPYAVGYSYIFYLDQFKTTQLSGTFGLQIHDFRFHFENDFLAFTSRDKYRTGAMGFYYRVGDWQFSLKNISFTGDPYSNYCPWIEDELFPSQSGYIDMSSAPLGNKSMGVLALQVERRLPINNYFDQQINFPLDQYAGVTIGIDAEQIRNAFQNKFVHDSKLLPLNWNDVKNPHIPMVCEDGCPYLYYDDQKIRKPKLYFQIHTNNPILY